LSKAKKAGIAVAAIVGIVVAAVLIMPGTRNSLLNFVFGTEDFTPDWEQTGPTPTPTPNDGGETVIGTWLSLTSEEDTVDRGDTLQLSVGSNFKNAPITFQAQYVGIPGWTDVETHNVGGNGALDINLECNFAGEWNLRVIYAPTGVVSDPPVNVVVEGLTLYQTKATWQVGDTFTAALSGSYKNWQVAILHKQQSDTNWIYVGTWPTDVIGRIPFGTATVLIDSSSANTVHNLIAVIAPSDPTGQPLYDLVEEYQGLIPATVIESQVLSGQLVESNILISTVVS
jgi:hypothetical protein